MPNQLFNALRGDASLRVRSQISKLESSVLAAISNICQRETVMGMVYDAEKRCQWIRDTVKRFENDKEALCRAFEKEFPDD